MGIETTVVTPNRELHLDFKSVEEFMKFGQETKENLSDSTKVKDTTIDNETFTVDTLGDLTMVAAYLNIAGQ